MIDKVRKYIEDNIGEKIVFKYDIGRNQIEEFEGVILKTYHFIFLVRVINSKVIKSFSYSDVLIGSLVMQS